MDLQSINKMSFKKRLFVFCSVIWLALVSVLGASANEGILFFTIFGCGPIALILGIRWLYQGYKAEKSQS